ncbi:glycerol kinase-like isoform X5 [Belonocnema kinseyi]|uniref:glycerol kinase-like isoform X5 n=1 Tax=Belonocnema kinseyi TaxID=2817044 RepID=UPI00143D5CFF|nr:glycerol kinase-like isoform X5 [Belonocnema kinseyi]
MNKNKSMSRYGPLVGAIDEGTSSVRFLVFAGDTAEVLTYHQVSISKSHPKEGWVEQNPMEILTAVKECLNQTVHNLRQLTIDPADIVAIGIANQRETSIIWDSVTGEPLYNAIVWMDMRTTNIVEDILKGVRNNKNFLKPLCGLPISPYFSAVKLKWLMENEISVQEAIKKKRCMFGTVDSWLIWCLGDQQSALVGQMCFELGQTKSTYGTGCFLLYNTGTAIVDSTHGLLTTVAYQLGPQSPPVYALEGSVAIAGALIQWLKDNMEILAKVKDCESTAKQYPNDNRIVFVPAFTGLYAPYWQKDARSVICGITEDTTSAHIVKAALQAVCFQTRDILEAMKKDTGSLFPKLLVDGSMTTNSLLMQMEADICGIPVVRPLMCETTALGAAVAAGRAEGIRRWDVRLDVPVPSDTFMPSITDNERDILYSQWKRAIKRSLGWEPLVKFNDGEQDLHKMTATGLFVIGTIIFLLVAKYRAPT